MPSKKQYNLVQNDDYDTRIPLHPEEAFHHGISFQAKYIGTLDVPRPSSRVEIVAAMRRIRYEFKAKGIKKKKVTVDVSVDGVRVSLRKKKKKKQWLEDESLMLMHHPIYRIFYVSHDSQDLKIFSYIARDSASDLFKCNVFKSNKKSQAMRVVRTVGQAFEVCHKLGAAGPGTGTGTADRDGDGDEASSGRGPLDGEDAAGSDRGSDRRADALLSEAPSCGSPTPTPAAEDAASLPDPAKPAGPGPGGGPAPRPLRLDILPPPAGPAASRRSPLGGGETFASPLGAPLRPEPLPPPGTPLGAHHELQLLREQLEQQAQQTQAAVAQVHLLRDQLAAETAARLEAQARTHQLLVHNKELLDHIAVLVGHLQEQERLLAQPQPQPPQSQPPPGHVVTSVPQMPSSAMLCDAQTPAAAPAYLPTELAGAAAAVAAAGLIENRGVAGVAASRPPSLYDQLFQQQLMQALGTYRPHAYYVSPPPPPLFAAPPPGYRVSQASSYSGSPVLPRAASSASAAVAAAAVAAAAAAAVAASAAEQEGEPDPEPEPSPRDSPPPQPKPPPLEAQFIKPLPHTPLPVEHRCHVHGLHVCELTSGSSARRQTTPTRSCGVDRERGRLLNGPPLITRSTSEKVPHRSELMSQVHRTAWARHTTK